MLPVNPTPGYHEEVQMHFMTAAGNPKIVLGSKEWVQIDAWYKSGVPLTCVLRGIDLAFQEHRKSRSRRPITSLLYCKSFVEDLARKFPKVSPVEGSEWRQQGPGLVGGSSNGQDAGSAALISAEPGNAGSSPVPHASNQQFGKEHCDPTSDRAGIQASGVPGYRGEDQAGVRPGVDEAERPGTDRAMARTPKREMCSPAEFREFIGELARIAKTKGLK